MLSHSDQQLAGGVFMLSAGGKQLSFSGVAQAWAEEGSDCGLDPAHRDTWGGSGEGCC